MPSSILIISTRYLGPILAGISLLVLYRGHNLPGGGFIGGLLFASAILLFALAHGWKTVNRRLPLDPLNLLALGLGLALLSALFALLQAEPFMTGLWLPAVELPVAGKIKLGSPLLFDLGVFLTVAGFTLKCAHALAQED